MTLAFAERPQNSAVRMQLIHTALRLILFSEVLTGGLHFDGFSSRRLRCKEEGEHRRRLLMAETP
jgi:hypothetical protein